MRCDKDFMIIHQRHPLCVHCPGVDTECNNIKMSLNGCKELFLDYFNKRY